MIPSHGYHGSIGCRNSQVIDDGVGAYKAHGSNQAPWAVEMAQHMRLSAQPAKHVTMLGGVPSLISYITDLLADSDA